MNWLSKKWQRIVAFWGTKEEARALGLFRIALGMVTLFSLLSIAGAGLVDDIWFSSEYGGMRRWEGNWLIQYFGGCTPTVVWSFWSASVFFSLLFTLGVFGGLLHGIVTLFVLQTYNALVTINPLASGGYDILITNAQWIMVFASSSSAYSLYTWKKEGCYLSKELISAWPRYVLLFQLLLMYTMTGIQKTGFVWTPSGGYSALYWVTQDLTWTRFDGAYGAWLDPLLRVGTAMAWHWEQLSIGLLIWYYCRLTKGKEGRLRRWVLRWDWRKGWALIGISMHVAILALMNVGPFSWISLSYYILLWRSEELVSGWGKFCRLWRKIRRSPAPKVSSEADPSKAQ